MAGVLPSFLSSAQLEIRIGSTKIAYAQNLTFTDDMNTAPVGGVGAYSFHAIEPTGYTARGSMTITHYSKTVRDRLTSGDLSGTIPQNISNQQNSPTDRDGNSLLLSEFFNPGNLLTSRTFDIFACFRQDQQNEELTQVYAIRNCRMTNLSFTFTPGTLVNQAASFMAIGVSDLKADDLKQSITEFSQQSG